MSLQKASISVPLGRGVDSKTSEPLVMPAKLLRLENGIFTRAGELRKRPGFQALPAVAGGPIIGDALACYDRELLMAASGSLFAYSPELGWQARGALRSLEVKASGVWADHTDQLFPSVGTLNGVTATAYESSAGGVRVTVTDEATGARLLVNTLVSASGSKPTVVACGGYLYVVYVYEKDPANFGLRWRRIAAGNPAALSGETVLLPDGTLFATKPLYAIKPFGGAMALAYLSAVEDLAISYVDPQGLMASAVSGYFDPVTLAGPWSDSSALALATVDALEPTLFLLYGQSTQLRAAAYNQALVATRAFAAAGAVQAQPIANVTGAADPLGGLRCFFEVQPAAGAAASTSVVRQVRIPSDESALGAFSDFYRSVGLGSEAWVQDRIPHVGLAYDSTFQSTFFVADTTKKIVARALVGRGGGLTGYPKLPTAAQVAPGRWAVVVGSKGRLESEAKQVTYFTRTITRLDLDFTAERFRSVQLGRNLHLAGAALAGYDGAQFFEAGFHVYPERCAVAGQEWVITWKDGTPGNAISINITPPADISDVPVQHSGSRVRPGSYIILWANDGARNYYWFKVDGLGSDPQPFGGADVTGIECDLFSTDDQAAVAAKLAAAIRSTAFIGATLLWGANVIAGNVVVAAPSAAVVISATDYTYPPEDEGTFAVQAVHHGDAGSAEKTVIVCPAGKWISGGQWFYLESSRRDATITTNSKRAFYFTVDGVGDAPGAQDLVQPGVDLAVTVPIAILSTWTPTQVAAKVLDALNGAQRAGLSLFSAALTAANSCTLLVSCVANTAGGYGTVDKHAYNNNVAAPLAQGNRLYYAIYRWTDAQGQLHRSAPSLPFTAISGDARGGANVVSVGTYRLTRRPAASVFVDVYRTPNGGELVPRLAKSLANDATVDAVTFTDSTSDSDLMSAEPLYTAGGEFENDPPPPSVAIGVHQGRLWLVDEYGVVWFSKPFADQLAVSWSSSLSFRVDKGAGTTVAITTLDDKGIVWKTDSILAFAGDGPDNTGGGQPFSTPQVISSDVGCISPESLVLTPGGWMFQSRKGIYLLDRSLQVTYLGAPVQAFNGQDVTSATLMPDVSQVRFTTSAGQSLVYDYVLDQWGSNTYQARHALLWGGSYVRLTADGVVHRETPGQYLDDGAPIRLFARTAWLKPADVQGYGRLYRLQLLARYESRHRLNCELAYDYDDTIRQQSQWDAAALLGGNAYGEGGNYGDGTFGGAGAGTAVEQLEVRAWRQKCEAVRVDIYDTPSDDGAGVSLVHLNLVVGVKGPFARLPNNRVAD